MNIDYSQIVLTKKEIKLLSNFQKQKIVPTDSSETRSLQDQRLIGINIRERDDSGYPLSTEYKITPEGERYLAYLKKMQHDFWLKSILTPIGVSVLTTLLTMSIPRLLEWVL